ncbi:hypothetical protein [Listeria virus P61]|nr:hypothetical protein [Listeria virus P61]
MAKQGALQAVELKEGAGVSITKTLQDKAKNYATTKRNYELLKKQLDALKDELMPMMVKANVKSLEILGDFELTYQAEVEGLRFNGKKLEKDHPHLYESYRLPYTTKEQLKFKDSKPKA